MKTPLAPDAIQHELESLPNWHHVSGKLHFEHAFNNFSEAFAFMTRVAMVAESMNHHPEWYNVWANVSIDLSTHDAGGITELDIQLARAINDILD